MIFYKTVCAGNDFLHVNTADYKKQYGAGSPALSKGELAMEMCRRHWGVGADGLIFYDIPADTAGSCEPDCVTFEIFNRDGTRAELSGNGMAGVSSVLFHRGVFSEKAVLKTAAGIRTHKLMSRDGNRFKLEIEIGMPDFSNQRFFPFLEPGRLAYRFQELIFYPLSVGNPHVVLLLEEPCDEAQLEHMGEILESADIFPLKTNVELVNFTDADNCSVFYYERGVGRTRSSSTGSAAVFALLREIKKIHHRLTISTAGEKIKIFGDTGIYIENYCKIVYKGVYPFLD